VIVSAFFHSSLPNAYIKSIKRSITKYHQPCNNLIIRLFCVTLG